jgi:hypothetical protein
LAKHIEKARMFRTSRSDQGFPIALDLRVKNLLSRFISLFSFAKHIGNGKSISFLTERPGLSDRPGPSGKKLAFLIFLAFHFGKAY